MIIFCELCAYTIYKYSFIPKLFVSNICFLQGGAATRGRGLMTPIPQAISHITALLPKTPPQNRRIVLAQSTPPSSGLWIGEIDQNSENVCRNSKLSFNNIVLLLILNF